MRGGKLKKFRIRAREQIRGYVDAAAGSEPPSLGRQT